MRSRLNLFFLIYSAVALVVTFVVHGALYFGFNLRTAAPAVWTVLQLSILLTLVGMVFCYRTHTEYKPELDEGHSSVLMWLTILYAVFLPYAAFNYFFYDYLMHYGHLDFVGRNYVIINKGQLVKAIAFADVPRYQLYEAREYSGHWMICNVILCGLAFTNVRPGD